LYGGPFELLEQILIHASDKKKENKEKEKEKENQEKKSNPSKGIRNPPSAVRLSFNDNLHSYNNT